MVFLSVLKNELDLKFFFFNFDQAIFYLQNDLRESPDRDSIVLFLWLKLYDKIVFFFIRNLFIFFNDCNLFILPLYRNFEKIMSAMIRLIS